MNWWFVVTPMLIYIVVSAILISERSFCLPCWINRQFARFLREWANWLVKRDHNAPSEPEKQE